MLLSSAGGVPPLQFRMDAWVASAVISAAWGGVALTLATLPGMWLALLVAVAGQWFVEPNLLSWWTIASAAVLVGLGEVVETVASAEGARRGGAGGKAMWASVAGSLVGALAGTILIPVPIAGTVIGAVLGAGLAAGGVEGMSGRGAMAASKAGVGAASGRLAGLIVKGVLAVAAATVLTVGCLR